LVTVWPKDPVFTSNKEPQPMPWNLPTYAGSNLENR